MVFDPNQPFHYNRGYKTSRINKSLSEEIRKKIFWVKLVTMSNFSNEERTYSLYAKDVNKSVPYNE